ncbi:MAG: GNAT family N-acetyltransferase [Acidimicrobiia bacterium]
MANEAARAATDADVPAVVALAELMRGELTPMRGGAVWSVREARPGPLPAAYQALLGREDTTLVVGTIDDVVVGFGAGLVDRNQDGRAHGVISELYVDPDARAVGVGEAMLGLMMVFFADRRCAGIDAMALPGHRAAKNFFEQQGLVARAIVMHTRLSG